MSNTVTTIRIDEDVLETIKAYAEVENDTMTGFLNRLLKDALSEYFLERSGGAVMRLPNPQLDQVDVKRYEEALELLSVATVKISSMGISMIPLLHNALAFYSQRLFADLPDEVERFKKNLIVDSTQCEEIAKNTNRVGKE